MRKDNFTMRELPDSERPYEKCERDGASALSNAELLAVVIKSGTRGKTSLSLALEILNAHHSYKGLMGLYHLTRQDLMQIQGIGPVKAVQILCAVELSKRLARESRSSAPYFSRPEQLAAYFMEEMRNLETEHLYLAAMDTSGRLLYDKAVFKGTINYSVVNPREILRLALQCDASQYVVLHNHPSGDPVPSREDIEMTKRLIEASDLIGIPLSDHIIIGDNRYISLKERGLI